MRRHGLQALFLTALIFVTTTQIATAQTVKISSEQRAQVESAISKFMETTKAPGISAAIVENGEIVWSAGFGMADLENRAPATSATLYRLGSVSKSLTATGAMQLWEAGKLDLDAPVQKYCPAFPQKEAPITTREVLGHLSGIRHYKGHSQDDPEIGNTRHFDNPIAGGLQFFANDPLVDKPGNKFHYSTQGYTLVGCVMQGASGENYVAYVTEHVLAPAGMTQTRPDDRFAIIPNRTRFYAKNKSGAIENADFLDSSYKIPGGGWLSSADDMAKFEMAMLNDRIVSRATRDIMWTPLKAADGKENGYALGWGWGSSEAAGVRDVGHSGGQQGTSTFFGIAPDLCDGVVVLVNLEDVDADALAAELMKVIVSTSNTSQPSH